MPTIDGQFYPYTTKGRDKAEKAKKAKKAKAQLGRRKTRPKPKSR